MKRAIPAVILALLMPMGLNAPPTSAAQGQSESIATSITPRNVTTLHVNAATGDDTTVDGCSAEKPCKTITYAIGQATPGSTINIAAGTYVENLDINKQLTLQCANAGVSAGRDAGNRGSESVIQGQADVKVAGTVIDGCKFIRPKGDRLDGKTRLIESVGMSGVVIVQNSILDLADADDPSLTGCGASVYGRAEWRIYANEFRYQRYVDTGNTACKDLYGSRAVWAEGSPKTIVSGNRFVRTLQSIFLTGSGSNVNSEVTNNIFTDFSQGPFIGVAQGVLVKGNTFESNGGVYLDQAVNTVVEENLFTQGNAWALWVAKAGASGTTTLRNNAILGGYPADSGIYTGKTVFNYGADAISAVGNWWGSSDDSFIATKLEGADKIDFSPYLSTGTDTSPATAGFQGDFAQVSVTKLGAHLDMTGRVQEGVDRVTAGGTVSVRGGTYAERVEISKQVNLRGPFADSRAWNSDGSPSWPVEGRAVITGGGASAGGLVGAVTLLTGSDGTTISGLEISGYREYAAINGRVVPANGGRIAVTNITIENNYILGSPEDGSGYGMYIDGNVQQPANAAVVRSLTVRGNLVIGKTTTARNVTGMWLWRQQGLVVEDNWLEGFDRGMNITLDPDVTGNNGEAKIKHNVVKDIPLSGVQLAGTAARGTEISISGNDFLNVNYEGVAQASGPTASAMIRFHNTLVLPSDSTVTIENNSLQQSSPGALGTGIAFLKPDAADTTVPFERVFIRNNSMAMPTEANRIAISAPVGQSAKTLIAENNLWGPGLTTELAIAASIWYANADSEVVTVDVNPWIINYTDDPAKAGQPGFWPIIQRAEAETLPGSDVTNTFTGLPDGGQVAVAFGQVTGVGGVTTVVAYDPANPASFPQAPSGFSLGTSPVYYTITTTATFSGSFELCLSYDPASFASPPKLYHFTGSPGAWVERVTSYKQGPPAQACATLTSFSEFALGVPTPSPGPGPGPGPGPVVQPPSQPRNVVGVPGDTVAELSWVEPVSSGSSAIVGYRVERSDTEGVWSVAIANTGSAERSVRVSDLVNGTAYRFRVTAINAAGPGPASDPSNAVTPFAPESVSILITGARTTIKGKPGIRVSGETTGLDAGAVLRPWFRFPGQKAFTRGTARILVGANAAFTWQRQTGKKITVYIQAGDGTRSNRVVIPAR